jgi:DNA-binding NarL/FixJ family response regulator
MTSLVLLVRDTAMHCRLVELLAFTIPDISPVGQALDDEQLLALARHGYWRVAVVDLLVARERPISTLERLRQECPRLPIVVFCFSLEPGRINRLLEIGVRGIVASEDISAELAPAIHSALDDEQYLSQAVQQALADCAAP